LSGASDTKRSVAAAALESFARWVAEEPAGRAFGEVLVRKTGEGYELRHRADAGSGDLEAYADPRSAQRIAQTTEDGEHRPLKSSPNLRRGWVLRLEDDRQLAVAMNYLYPAALVHRYLEQEGRLETTSYRENAARQTGIYEVVRNLSDAGVQAAAKAHCADEVCLKRPLWGADPGTPLEMEPGEGEIPCPEPCSLFVSFARQITKFESEGRDVRVGLTASERKDLAALVEAAAAAGELPRVREGEFDLPANRRRMRYRALTLVPRLREHLAE
jgi:sirohydrochlorin ferrochelatase